MIRGEPGDDEIADVLRAKIGFERRSDERTVYVFADDRFTGDGGNDRLERASRMALFEHRPGRERKMAHVNERSLRLLAPG